VLLRFSRRGALLPAAAVLMAVVIGCGSGDASDLSRAAPAKATLPPPDDTTIAQRAQLRLGDFPDGWREHYDPDHQPANCKGIRGPRAAASGRAMSPNFRLGDYPAATSAVYVYADEAKAGDMLATMSARRTLLCLAKKLKQRLLRSNRRLEVGEPSIARVRVQAVGDERKGGRVTLPVTAEGVDVDLVADYIFVRVGRGVALLALADTFSAFEKNLRNHLTATLTRRLAAELS
jgi:hypothetical protein